MKFGFIGCGNMGGALAKALAHSTKDILISDRSGNAKPLAAELGCVYGSVAEAAGCEFVFLGVKPQMMAGVLSPLQPIFAEKQPILISMAAGLTIETIVKYAGAPLPVLRIMPNTPVSVGKGMTGFTPNARINEDTLRDFLSDMEEAGLWEQVEETQMDTVAALSGSGPAYAYYFTEALCRGAECCGMDKDQALRYAIATLEGAAEMMKQGNVSPEQLRIAVCSPGGSTLAGLKALDDAGFSDGVENCVKAAYNRNKELAKM
jgi:pyrroline-5-carboxylate reductase